jgi:hypothetical protein
MALRFLAQGAAKGEMVVRDVANGVEIARVPDARVKRLSPPQEYSS